MSFDGYRSIAYHEPSRGLVLSANAPSGQPRNLKRIGADGTATAFSSVGDLTGELPVAAARGEADGRSLGGFLSGEVFAGSDAPGTILRVAPSGEGTALAVVLPNEPGRVTALTIDTTGRFGGDLLAATSAGNVWRVGDDSTARLVATLGSPVSSLVVLAYNDTKYGPWSGRLVALAGEEGVVWAIDPSGARAATPLGLSAGHLAVVPRAENFYGVDASAERLVAASATQFATLTGDVLIAQESPGLLLRVLWNGTAFDVDVLAEAGRWTGITFAPSGLDPAICGIPTVAATTRHAPDVSGVVEGSIQLLRAESAEIESDVQIAGGAVVTGDLIMPGTPSVTLSGTPTFGGTVDATGSIQPTSHRVTLRGTSRLGRLVRRTDAVPMRAVPAPPAPSGTRDVTISSSGGSIGDPATLRNLTLTGGAGVVSVPPGTYGTFTAGGGTGFRLGVAGSAEPSVYHLTQLDLGGQGTLEVVGPVRLVLATATAFNGTVGNAANPLWLTVEVASGGVTIHGPGTMYGIVRAPSGTVVVEGTALLFGASVSDRLTVRGNGLIKWMTGDSTAPVVSIDTPEACGVVDAAEVTVAGRVASDGPITVTVAGVVAAVSGQTFSATVPLEPGENTIEVVATDWAGNTGAASVLVRRGAAPNQPPAVDTGADRVVDVRFGVDLEATVSDDGAGCGATLATFWRKVSGPGDVTFDAVADATTHASFSEPGTYVLRFVASDTESLASDDVTVTVTPPNAAPTVDAGPDQTVHLPGSATLAGVVSDDGLPTGAQLITQWQVVSGPGTVTFANAASSSTSAEVSAPGQYVLRLSANDIEFAVADEVTITVIPANQPPVVDAGPDQTVFLPNQAVLSGVAQDDGLPDGTLAFAWSQVSGPAPVAFDTPATPATPVRFSAPGVYVFRLTVSDSALSASGETTVTVEPGNGAPSILSTPQPAILLEPITSAASTVDLRTWTAHAIDIGIQPDASWSVNATGTLVNQTVNSDPSFFVSDFPLGYDRIEGKLRVNTNGDDDFVGFVFGFQDTGHFYLFDWKQSDQTSANAGFADAGMSVKVVDASTPLAERDLWPTAGNGARVRTLYHNTIPWDEFVDYTFTLDFRPGSFTITIKQGATVLDTFTLSDETYASGSFGFYNYSQEQVAYQGFTRSVLAEGTYQYQVVASDPDSDPLTYELVDAPTGMTISASGLITWPVTGAKSGSHEVRVRVSDPEGLVAEQAWTLEVGVRNLAPAASAGADRIASMPNASTTITGSATDDGLPANTLGVTWSKTSGPGTVTFDNVLSPVTVARFSATGTYVLRLTATDGELQAFDELTVIVTAQNQAPVVSAGPNRVVQSPPMSTTLTGTASDDGLPLGSSLALTWSKVSGPGTVSFSSPSSATTNVTVSLAGTYVLRLRGTDSVLTTTDDMTLTVHPPNQAPVVSAGPDRALALPATQFALSGTATDDGLPLGSSLTVMWSTVSGPGVVTFANPSSAATTATITEPGTYVVRLTASDSLLTRFDEATLTLAPENHAPVVSAGADRTTRIGANLLVNPSAEAPLTNGEVPGWVEATGGEWTVANAGAGSFPAALDGAGYFYAGEAIAAELRQDVDVSAWAGPIDAGTQAFSIEAFVRSNAELIPDRTSVRVEFRGAGNFALLGTLTGNAGPSTVDWQRHANTQVAPVGTRFLRVFLVATRESGISNDAFFDAVSLRAEGPAAVALAGTVTDDGLPSGAPLTSTWSVVSGAGSVAFSSASSPATGATFATAGAYVLRLAASDTQLGATDDVAVTIGAANAAPVVSAGADWTVTGTGAVALTGTATDDGAPAGSNIALRWVLLSGPGTAIFADPTAASTSVELSAPGVYLLRLWAGDGDRFASDEVTITVERANEAPVVNAGPDATVVLPDAGLLQGSVVDDDLPAGSTLVSAWSVVSGPRPVTFANAAAEITTVHFTYPGTYVFRLTTTDGELSGSDEVTVVVTENPVNEAPQVTAGPDLEVSLPDAVASLGGAVVDDGRPYAGTLTSMWSVVSGPGTVAFGDATRPQTTATFTVAGVYTLRLTASDGEHTAGDDVVVTVYPSNEAPTVNAGVDQVVYLPNQAALGSSVTDDGRPSGVLTFAWSVASGPGTVTFSSPTGATTLATFGAAGVYVIRLTVSDSELSGFDELEVEVRESVAPPEVSLTSPVDGTAVTEPVAVVGSVSHGEWRLEYTRGNVEDAPVAHPWTQLATGTGAVTNQQLATFDPTIIGNGVYTIRLVAIDEAGQTATATTAVLVEGGVKVGIFNVAFLDLELPVAGIPIQVIRSYTTADRSKGDFGHGWTLSLRNIRLDKTVSLGRYWRQTSTGGSIPQYALDETRAHTVAVTMPDGRVYKFRASIFQSPRPAIPFANGFMQFGQVQATAGTEGARLELDGAGANEFLVDPPNLPGLCTLKNAQLGVYNPTRFRMTTRDGTVYVVDELGGLKEVREPNGNRLVITATSITYTNAATGATLAVLIHRDDEGRIDRITDPANVAMTYEYDANGDLVAFVDREEQRTAFTYDGEHYLLTIKDPRLVTPLTNGYVDGRLTSQTDAYGKTIGYAHDLVARRATVTDREGNPTIYEYDARGNVVRLEDAEGGVMRFTYDGADRKLTETRELDATTSFTSEFRYDVEGDLVETKDPTGVVTTYTHNDLGQALTAKVGTRVAENFYDGRGNLLWTEDPLDNRTTMTYRLDGQVETVTAADTGLTRYTYDGWGYLVGMVDAEGNTTSYAVDNQGRRFRETRTRTKADGTTEPLVTEFDYDLLGRHVRTTYPDLTFERMAYDATGQVKTRWDRKNRPTGYQYDLMGRLERTTYPDTRTEETVYDDEGRALRRKDRAGRWTGFRYDRVGRLVETTFADTRSTETNYDRVGRVEWTKDELGRQTRFFYDAAGRRTRVVDALSKETLFQYDAVFGQLESMEDANHHRTSYVYDGAGRSERVIFHDTTYEQTTYDVMGRVVARRDQAGKVTQFGYDELGRLIRVTDARDKETEYRYDEVGSLVEQEDALDRVTKFAYDAMGRRVRRELPGGQVETYGYDVAGNMDRRTDFNGFTTTYQFDTLDRLKAIEPDARRVEPAVAFTYTATGRRETMTDGHGLTSYQYDSRDRLLSKSAPEGTLTYTYHATGDLATLRSSNAGGVSIDYAYDSLNRLDTVTDNRLGGAVTDYGYDEVGNLASVQLANGVRTDYTYNTLNRLTDVVSSRAGTTVASYHYVLGAAGNRESVTEHTGRTARYTYDALYRLTREEVTNDPAGMNGVVDYVLDEVGNRLSRTSTVPGVGSTTSTFDANDRLASDQYDANGNTVGSNGNGYQYDYANRIVALNAGTPAEVRFVYDGDGNRVAETTGGMTTRYVVDTNNPTGYAQVVEEINETAGQPAQVSRVYTYGLDLISQYQPIGGTWTASFYGYDGHGSVRYLTDSQGIVSDTFDYDAYGLLIRRTGTTPNDYLYAGEQYDPTLGYYYLRARYLNPEQGRFASMDSYEGSPNDPLSLHKYAYANSNAVNLIDPSGHSPLAAALIAVTIVALVATMACAPPHVGPPNNGWTEPHVRRSWTPQDEEDFRSYIQQFAETDRYLGVAMDCADLAISMLVDFAADRNLPVILSSNLRRAGAIDIFDSRMYPPAPDKKAKYLGVVKRATNAQIVFDFNTYEKGQLPEGLGGARPGDLLMLRRPSNPNAYQGHTRIFLGAQGSSVRFIQGNLGSNDQPLGVVVQERSVDYLSGENNTRSIRWWKPSVFGRQQ